jgi:hypothetical protein
MEARSATDSPQHRQHCGQVGEAVVGNRVRGPGGAAGAPGSTARTAPHLRNDVPDARFPGQFHRRIQVAAGPFRETHGEDGEAAGTHVVRDTRRAPLRRRPGRE